MKKAGIARTVTAICLLCSLLLWLFGMLYLTLQSAILIGANCMDQASQRMDNLYYSVDFAMEHTGQSDKPGAQAYAYYQGLAPGLSLYTVSYFHHDLWFIDEAQPDYTTAAALYDSAGNCLARRQNALYFSYFADEGRGYQEGLAVVLLDEQFPDAQPNADGVVLPELTWAVYDNQRYDRLRFTGALNDGILTLQRFEGSVNRYSDEWEVIFEAEPALPADAEMVTLYTQPAYVQRIGHKVDPALDAIMDAFIDDKLYGDKGYAYAVHDLNQLRYFYFYSFNDYWLVGTIETSPLRLAADCLTRLYIVSFVLSALWPLLVGWVLRRWVEKPLRIMNDDAENGIHHAFVAPNERYFREIDRLTTQYNAAADELEAARDEIKRLNTALDYAQDAEQRRRTLVSNLTHELKTPLAIIHSYAEGLKERIAEDRREEYLEVLLSESEHMDALVLEMLDLSRLEAGRVKLARDVFSLTELVQSAFERLSLAAEAKGLRVTLDCAGDCTVIADRRRMAQVVENFASNAVKYTPAGGEIRVRVQKHRQGARCEIENDGAPLSVEALEKVWDSFYRSDASRHTEGTGLGLAIARSVVELHGGRCDVRNTERGVCFGFEV